MARTKEFESADALNKALSTFMEKGFAATSIQDLVTATGVNRQSLYNEFGDKRQLYIKALEGYCALMKDNAAQILTLDEPARMVLEKYKASIKANFQCQAGSKGCLVVSAIMDASTSDPEVKAIINKLMQAKGAMMEKVIARGQKAGELPTKHSPRAVTQGLHAAITGIVVMARNGTKCDALLPVLDVAFEGLV
jgi:TetR/AcrR family transcriptional repressor of nem operon